MFAMTTTYKTMLFNTLLEVISKTIIINGVGDRGCCSSPITMVATIYKLLNINGNYKGGGYKKRLSGSYAYVVL